MESNSALITNISELIADTLCFRVFTSVLASSNSNLYSSLSRSILSFSSRSLASFSRSSFSASDCCSRRDSSSLLSADAYRYLVTLFSTLWYFISLSFLNCRKPPSISLGLIFIRKRLFGVYTYRDHIIYCQY